MHNSDAGGDGTTGRAPPHRRPARARAPFPAGGDGTRGSRAPSPQQYNSSVFMRPAHSTAVHRVRAPLPAGRAPTPSLGSVNSLMSPARRTAIPRARMPLPAGRGLLHLPRIPSPGSSIAWRQPSSINYIRVRMLPEPVANWRRPAAIGFFPSPQPPVTFAHGEHELLQVRRAPRVREHARSRGEEGWRGAAQVISEPAIAGSSGSILGMEWPPLPVSAAAAAAAVAAAPPPRVDTSDQAVAERGTDLDLDRLNRLELGKPSSPGQWMVEQQQSTAGSSRMIGTSPLPVSATAAAAAAGVDTSGAVVEGETEQHSESAGMDYRNPPESLELSRGQWPMSRAHDEHATSVLHGAGTGRRRLPVFLDLCSPASSSEHKRPPP